MEKANNADAWTIDYSVGKKCVYISTNDYHADPLKLSAEQLRIMLHRLDPPEKPLQLPPDAQRVEKQTSPFYGISKKEKCFYIGIPEGWTGLLKFSQDDLHRFAGMMNRRVKTGKKGGGILPPTFKQK